MNAWKLFAAITAAAVSIAASDMDKFYHVVPHRTADVATNLDPIFHPSSGDLKRDAAAMYTAGFEAIGYASGDPLAASRALFDIGSRLLRSALPNARALEDIKLSLYVGLG